MKTIERVKTEGGRLKTVYCYKCESAKWFPEQMWNKEKTRIEADKYTCATCGNVVIE